jgi:16S rRNA (cytidine1402-2'-O)-methyltransferase
METGKLYIVATPMGNLGDITLRAIEILKKVDYIACEDTRKTGVLLRELGIGRKSMLISYYEQTEEARVPNILNLLRNGIDVALVSDSGTPLISDPGYRLVKAAKDEGIVVVSIPGATALVSALVSSGLPTDKFHFLGFLPKKEGNRVKLLQNLKSSQEFIESTVIFYEAPHRLIKSLQSLEKVYGDIEICIGRELTKVHEENIKLLLSEAINKYQSKNPKGEFVVLFSPKDLSGRDLSIDLK